MSPQLQVASALLVCPHLLVQAVSCVEAVCPSSLVASIRTCPPFLCSPAPHFRSTSPKQNTLIVFRCHIHRGRLSPPVALADRRQTQSDVNVQQGWHLADSRRRDAHRFMQQWWLALEADQRGRPLQRQEQGRLCTLVGRPFGVCLWGACPGVVWTFDIRLELLRPCIDSVRSLEV